MAAFPQRFYLKSTASPDDVDGVNFHRMCAELNQADFTQRQDDPNYLRPLNCKHDCTPETCTDVCIKECCTGTGIPVNMFIKKELLNWHLILYRAVLNPLLVLAQQRENPNISRVDAESEANTRLQKSSAQFIITEVLPLLHRNDLRLPRCVIRQTAPQGTRLHMDSIITYRRHGVIQPLNDQISVGAFNQIALGQNEGWADCPFFLEAAADPAVIASCSFPPPSAPLVAAMASSLQKLLEYHAHLFVNKHDIDETSLFELSGCIVSLSTSPKDVIFGYLDMKPTFQTLDFRLAKFLLDAFERGYVNIEKPTFADQVRLISNTLGMPADQVEQTVPFFHDDAQACARSTILSGQ